MLPSRVVVYLLLAGCLFAELGYRRVAQADRWPGASRRRPRPRGALWQARAPAGRRAAAVAVRPAARPGHGARPRAVRWRGLLVCAIDGTTMTIPDSPANLAGYSKQAGNHGGSGYPLLRLVALVACGTRTVIDAVFGPASCGEQDYARRLLAACTPGMIVLPDRNFDAAALIGQLAAHEGRPAWSASRAAASCRCCAATVTGPSCRRSAPCRCG